MAMKKACKDEIEEAPARNPPTTRKRKRGSSASAASTSICECDDVLRSIFARLPVRTLVASMALSKHHRRMILSPEFRSLCCRLGPPLPAPHIAYIATAKISSSCGQRVPQFPRRQRRRRAQLLQCPDAIARRPKRCVLWNPCVANSDKEVAIPGWNKNNGDGVLGFGYGKRSQTFKILIWRRCECDSYYREHPKDLLVYSLRDTQLRMDADSPRQQAVLALTDRDKSASKDGLHALDRFRL
ncbi:hypothetical protein C2845_PM02G33990 [Panicum miliaceum]|uniref:F-box domain-containing protein n=1 Tax=Panicum miliaceum TaxID=4540 RepID=A0A3L6SHH7_PANMI|nr:hypothetical protein C2845_PM02G33990 [Panicum miliaceum]